MLIAFMFVFLDPYAVVGFGTQSQLTRVLDKTLSPMWDQTLIFDEITLYGPAELVAQNPPEVVIEVFDKDLIGKDEFFGQDNMQADGEAINVG
ncbi:hypothetical protein EB796_001113 [Bugula neritina]|uniref:C2 domain-containing protein n=1 Tax=Bugula neritina TaxID=10212 RepID=A0A7J7KR54_BUGNE|nr:hypothetical protein EB796_001113 [Bugula neritina]